MNTLTTSRHAVLLAALCLLMAWPAAAQVATTGRITGKVVDASGAPVARVTVKARHVATDTAYAKQTDGAGEYEFNLPPGTYDVTTEVSPSSGAAVRTVQVTLGGTATADFDPSTPKVREAIIQRSRLLEASARVGWTLSDGISARANIEAGDGNVYNRIDVVDSVSWGLTLGVFLNQNFELEFLFARQASTLQVEGTSRVDVGDLNVGNYHGVLAYNFGAKSRAVRFYAFLGAGATTYSSLTFTGREGEPRTIGGSAKFSGTGGGGVKIYRGPIGARLEARFTPTFIRSTDDGWWCDPYWGCYPLDARHYAKQFELSSGLTVRF